MSFREIHQNTVHEVVPLVKKAVDGSFSKEVLQFRLQQTLSYDDYQCWSIYHKNQTIGVFGLWKCRDCYEVDHLYIQEGETDRVLREKVLQDIDDLIMTMKSKS